MTNDQFQMTNKLPITNAKHGKFDIYDRCMSFALRAAKLVDIIPRKPSLIEYGKQLIRSSASIGANMEEADGALTKKDFVNKVGIARREAKESNYWLKLIEQTIPNQFQELDILLRESKEIKLILSSIINKTRGIA